MPALLMSKESWHGSLHAHDEPVADLYCRCECPFRSADSDEASPARALSMICDTLPVTQTVGEERNQKLEFFLVEGEDEDCQEHRRSSSTSQQKGERDEPEAMVQQNGCPGVGESLMDAEGLGESEGSKRRRRRNVFFTCEPEVEVQEAENVEEDDEEVREGNEVVAVAVAVEKVAAVGALEAHCVARSDATSCVPPSSQTSKVLKSPIHLSHHGSEFEIVNILGH
jgi:hypothetical protein